MPYKLLVAQVVQYIELSEQNLRLANLLRISSAGHKVNKMRIKSAQMLAATSLRDKLSPTQTLEVSLVGITTSDRGVCLNYDNSLNYLLKYFMIRCSLQRGRELVAMTARIKTARWLHLDLAAVILFILWIAYTAIYTFAPGGILSAGLDLIPGIAGVIVLAMGAGFKLQECYLKPARISLKGLVLLLLFLFALIPILLTGRWVGWDWKAGLLYAPASGIAQELFFRASLLPVTMKVFKNNRLFGVLAQSVLFVVWHMPVALMKAPLLGAIGIIIVTFIGGIVWGWQVQRDKTVYWAMGQHIIYLMLMSLFVWE